jgi:hypothetical protein
MSLAARLREIRKVHAAEKELSAKLANEFRLQASSNAQMEIALKDLRALFAKHEAVAAEISAAYAQARDQRRRQTATLGKLLDDIDKTCGVPSFQAVKNARTTYEDVCAELLVAGKPPRS